MRVFLALWLVLFAVQTSDLIAVVSPDECVDAGAGAPGDACPDSCARCICCARVPVVVLPAPIDAAPAAVASADRPASVDPATDPAPRGILHVPRHS